MDEKKSKSNPSDNFAEMMKDFGSAIAEIFNDPALKEKAKEFGQSATDSAQTFASRFKDEDVKKKFKDLGTTAKKFGDSVAAYFKDDTNKTGSGSTGQDTESGQQPEDSQDDEGGDDKEEPETTGNQAAAKEVISSIEKQDGTVDSSKVKVERGLPRSERDRNARITGYCFAIAWSIIFLIFFNFFNKYIAFYLFDSQSETWITMPVITSAFGAWLPFVNASLLVSIIGNAVLIINDSFYFNNITNIVMHFFSISAAAALLILFPFDFTVMQTSVLSEILVPLIRIVLIVIIVGLSVGAIARFIKIIVKAVRA